MTTPTSLPDLTRDAGRPPVALARSWETTFRSMATTVRVILGPGTLDPPGLSRQVEAVFAETESECTRFDDSSDLMTANAAGEAWCAVSPYCFAALREAAHAYEITDGIFDPRVLETLEEIGYRRSVRFGDPELELVGVRTGLRRRPAARWTPVFDSARHRVRVGDRPIDLGGIGKGLAVRWAAKRLDAGSGSFLIDAGGDCYVRGTSPDGAAWRIGVENPHGGDRPIAVLALVDSACVTSSIRLRQWRTDGRRVHHLIDPRTGAPGGAGLRSVTVVAADAAYGEVWSKVFFLHGREGIWAAVDARDDVAVLWVEDDGTVGMNDSMRPMLIWEDTT